MSTISGFIVPINTVPVQHYREDLNEFLTISTRPCPNQSPTVKLLSITNHSPTLRGTVVLAFDAEVGVVALGRTVTSTRPNEVSKRPETVFTVDVNPFEKLDVLRGPYVTHDGRKVSAAAAPKEFFQERAAAADVEVAREMGLVQDATTEEQRETQKRLATETTSCSPKITTEFIAQVCSRRNLRFVDLGFPPVQASLVRPQCDQGPLGTGPNPIIFCRPNSLLRGTAKLRASLPIPSLFGGVVIPSSNVPVQRIDPADVRQGTLGNCYLCCSLSSLAAAATPSSTLSSSPSVSGTLIRDIFSPQQEPTKGIFRVLMCKHGWWLTHIVDDFLPTQSGTFCFSRNKQHPTQLWVPILEKAYARAHGSFAAIRAGDTASALMDFTGGRYVHLQKLPEYKNPPQLFDTIRKALREEGKLVTVGTPGKAVLGDTFEAKKKEYDTCGITLDHAYSVLDAVVVNGTRLVLLRDPWSGGANAASPKVWNGMYGPGDTASWTPRVVAELASVANPRLSGPGSAHQEDQGRFWIPFDDLLTKYIDNGCICDPLRSDPQIRVQATMDTNSGWVNTALRLRVTGTTPLQCHFGLHQKDRRSIPSKTPPAYVGVLLMVFLVDLKLEKTISLIATSDVNNGTTFGVYRDVFTDTVTLPPNESNDTAYMVVAQCLRKKPAGVAGAATAASTDAAYDVRPLVISAMLRNPEVALSEVFVGSLSPGESRGTAGACNTAAFMPPSTFQPQNYSTAAANSTTWQVRTTRGPLHASRSAAAAGTGAEDGVSITTRSGALVDPALWGFTAVSPTPRPLLSPVAGATPQTSHHSDPSPLQHLADATAPALLPQSSPSPSSSLHCTSHLHLLVLDVVLEIPSSSTASASVATTLAAVRVSFKPLDAAVAMPVDQQRAAPACSFTSRNIAMKQESNVASTSGEEGQQTAMDGVVRDEQRSFGEEGSAASQIASSVSMRGVWCEGKMVPLYFSSEVAPMTTYLDDFLIQAEIVGTSDGSVVVLGQGSAKLKSRRLSLDGTGQMMTVSLFSPPAPLTNNNQGAGASADTATTATKEIGELHLGISWVRTNENCR